MNDVAHDRCSDNFGDVSKKVPPELLILTPGLLLDTHTLSELLSEERPSLVSLRFNQVRESCYGFGDASGTVFSLTIIYSNDPRAQIGMWLTTKEDETSSNWKEISNVTESLEKEGEKLF